MKRNVVIIFILLLWISSLGQATAQENALKIYIPQDDFLLCKSLEQGIQLMKKSHPEVTIQAEYLPGYWYDGEYAKRLSTELMAGGGPDIIAINEATFPDVQKAARSNLFADLSVFLEADQSFDRSSYMQPALDSGIIGNQQIYLPTFLKVPCLVSTEEILASCGLANPQLASMNLMEFLSSLTDADAVQYFSEEYTMLYTLLSASGISLIDYDRMAVDLNSESNRAFFEVCSKIYAKDYKTYDGGTTYSSNTDIFNGLDHSDYLYGVESYSFETLFINNALLSGASYTPVTVVLPTIDGGERAFIASALAINANSQNKEAAYAFIQTMLSQEVQYPSTQDWLGLMPVRVDGWKGKVASRIEFNTSHGLGGTELPVGKLPESLVDYFVDGQDMITECGFVNWQVLDMCFEAMQPYYDGKKTLDEALRELQFKLELYAGE